ncbi:MAG TPA: RDD family protein [Xanthobacteraceae bacterium]|nr:RDD family protein [Xanthobacteraceae bacterium]
MFELPRAGMNGEPKPDAYDPDKNPECFEGVLPRRVVAFFIDVALIVGPIILLALFIFIFGLVTFGLGWFLFWTLSPVFVIWAILYVGLTLAAPQSATLGMRVMELELRTWYGGRMYFLLGAVHAIFFWVSVSALSPFVLLVGLVNRQHRLLHDFLTGTVMINNASRAAALRRPGKV